MSRPHVYAWVSLWSSLSFLAFYLLVTFGIPRFLEPWSGHVIQLVVVLFLVDLVAQAVLSIRVRSNRVERDERDDRIEALGFKVGYRVFVVAITILMGHVFILRFMESWADPAYLATVRSAELHYLVLTFITGTTAKSVTQLFQYRKEA